MRGWLVFLLFLELVVEVLPRGSARGRSRLSLSVSNDISGKKACPSVRFRRRGCTNKYECNDICKEKVQCKTQYKYKCTDYRRQECKNVWQNQCNGKKGRRRRSPRSRSPPYWLDPSNTRVIDDPPPLSDPSDLPLFSPGVGGQVFDFASEPRSKKCWQKVRKCDYKKYRTTCGNVPMKTCDDKPTTQCKKTCKNVFYCDKCPNKKPRPRPTSRPKPRPTPRPTRPTRPIGPPSPPPPGAFIVSSPAPPPRPLEAIIDAKRNRRRIRNKP